MSMTNSRVVASGESSWPLPIKLAGLLKRCRFSLIGAKGAAANRPYATLGSNPQAADWQPFAAVTASALRQRPVLLTLLSGLMVLLVGVLDWLTAPQVSLAVFYFLPVVVTAWHAGKRNGLVLAMLAGVVWSVTDAAEWSPPLHPAIATWNLLSRVGVLSMVVLLIARIRALQNGLETAVANRTRQLEAEIARCRALEHDVAEASAREQQHLAHELHDGLGQELGGLAFHAKVLAAQLANGRAPQAAHAERLVAMLNQSAARTRALSNLLDPVRAEPGGMPDALAKLAERSSRVFNLRCTAEAPEKLPTLSAAAELDLYRITQEAIHNAVQHGAASSVRVKLTLEPQVLRLTISDNGRGFAPQTGPSGRDRGMGLRIMRYRASDLSARLDVSSTPGQGCTVSCAVPLP
jgi:signal transduction histidine kinase